MWEAGRINPKNIVELFCSALDMLFSRRKNSERSVANQACLLLISFGTSKEGRQAVDNDLGSAVQILK